MDERDAFFTQTIVGAPFTVLLGRRVVARQGLRLDLRTGIGQFSEGWRDWVALGRSHDLSGLPRRRPGRWVRWLERHALPLAASGLCSLALGVLLIGLSRWH